MSEAPKGESDAAMYDRVFGAIFQEYLLPVIEAQGKDIQSIISAASGMGLELAALMRLFPNAAYLGVDADQLVVSSANMLNKHKDRAAFAVRDLRDPAALQEETADLLLIRHPQIARDSAFVSTTVGDWEAIFRNSIAAVKPSGIVYLSTKFQDETTVAKKYLEQGNITVVAGGVPSVSGFGADSHVLIGVKS